MSNYVYVALTFIVVSTITGPSLPMIGIILFLRAKRLAFGTKPTIPEDSRNELPAIECTTASTESVEKERGKPWPDNRANTPPV